MSSVKASRIFNRVDSSARQPCVNMSFDSDGGSNAGSDWTAIQSGFIYPKYNYSLFLIFFHFGMSSSNGQRGSIRVLRRVYNPSTTGPINAGGTGTVASSNFTDTEIWSHVEGIPTDGYETIRTINVIDRPRVTNQQIEYILMFRGLVGATIDGTQPNFVSGNGRAMSYVMEFLA